MKIKIPKNNYPITKEVTNDCKIIAMLLRLAGGKCKVSRLSDFQVCLGKRIEFAN